MKNYTIDILEQLSQHVYQINSNELKEVISKIKTAPHIFLSGSGRSGLAAQGFANRLLHLGFSVSVVGEITSPHSHTGDILIICSGSGETLSLKSLAQKAKKQNISIILFTTNKNSTIGKLASIVVNLPGKSKNISQTDNHKFHQPMGAEFEQLSFLTFDGLILNLMDELNENSNSMLTRHADFE